MQNSFTINVDDAYLQALQDDFSLDEESCDEDSDPNMMNSIKPETIPTEKIFVNHNALSSQENTKKAPPPKGKKTKGRVKIKMEFIDNKLRRYTTFSKRKTGIMKKAYELSTLTGTQVMLLVASETGHVYTFATRKLQPMITSEAGKALIQTCLNTPDLPNEESPSNTEGGGGSTSPDQRMSATGFEETELSYSVGPENEMDFKVENQSSASHSPSNGGHFITVPSPSSSPQDTQASKGEATSQPSFATLIAQDGNLSQAIPFGSLQALAAAGHNISNQGGSPLYRLSIPTTMTTVTTSPTSGKASRSSPNAPATSQATSTVTVAAAPQLIPANVVLPNGSTGIVYQTPQGVMYAPARADNASGGLILKLQDQGATISPSFITIPYPIATSSASTPTTQESKGSPLPKMPKLSRPSKK